MLAVAACGGGGSKSAAKVVPTTTTTESLETRQWVDAAAKGLIAGDDTGKITVSQAQCMAHALVDTVTVAQLKASGTTLADLTDPNKNLPAKLASSVPVETQTALGGAIQGCHFGELLAPELASSFASDGGVKPSAQVMKCLVDGFGAPAQQLLIGQMILNSGSNATPAEANAMAGVIDPCIDWSVFIAKDAPFKLEAAESSCINRLFGTDPDLRKVMASEIEGTKPGNSVGDLVGARMISCLTPAHILQIGKSP
jgi:hypothetical protein